MALALIEFFHMEIFRGANAFAGLACARGVACDSSCGHMVCNQSRWELMGPKWDQPKSSSAFHSLFISLSVSPQRTRFAMLSTAANQRRQKCCQPFPDFFAWLRTVWCWCKLQAREDIPRIFIPDCIAIQGGRRWRPRVGQRRYNHLKLNMPDGSASARSGAYLEQ